MESVKDKEELRAEVETLARDIMLLVRTVAIYPQGHPQMNKMADRVVYWSKQKGHEDLSIGVTSSELVVGGEFFGGKESRAELLARFLNSRKVARISFGPGLSASEVYLVASRLGDRNIAGENIISALENDGVVNIQLVPLDLGAIHDQMTLEASESVGDEEAALKKRREMWLWLQSESGSPKDMARVLSSPEFWQTTFDGAPESFKELSQIFARLGSMLDRTLRMIPEDKRGEIGQQLAKLGAGLDSEHLARLVDVLLSDSSGTGESLSFLMKFVDGEKMADLLAGLVSLGGDKEARISAFAKSFLGNDAMLAIASLAGDRKQSEAASGYPSEVWEWVESFLVDFDENKYMGKGYRETLDRMASRLKIEGERGAAFGMFEDAEMHLDHVMIGISLYNVQGSEAQLAERITERLSDMDSFGIMSFLEMVDNVVPDALVGRQDVMEIFFRKVVPDIKDYAGETKKRVIGFATRHESEILEVGLRTLLMEERLSVRRFLVELMCHFSSNSAPVIVRKARGSIWYFMRNCMIILGRIGDQRAFPFIIAQLDHEKPQVRREALRAMAFMGERGFRALQNFQFESGRLLEERQLAKSISDRMKYH
jgi:hypothetical protein